MLTKKEQNESKNENLRYKFLPFSVINKLWHGKGINHCENVIPKTNNMSTN